MLRIHAPVFYDLQSLNPILSFAADSKATFGIDKPDQSLAHEGMIVNNQNPSFVPV